MSNTNNGGPAFPVLDFITPEKIATCKNGMSLRDWFAGKAMQSLAMHEEYPPERAAKCAYEYADAMLRARDGGGVWRTKSA